MKTNFLIPLIAGLGLLCACKSKGGAAADSTTTDFHKAKMVNNADTTQVNSKLVKTADMNFQVKNVQQTTEKITELTTSFNGIVMHHVMNSTVGNSMDIQKSTDSTIRVTVVNSTAEMTVKVPPANMENFMNQVARLGMYVNNSKMDVSDKTLDYLSTHLKLKNQNDLVDQNKEAKSKKTPDELLAFKNNMVDQQISNRRIDDSVKKSVVTLSFYQSNVITKQVIANDNLSAYKLPFYKRIAISVENGWDIFIDIIVGVANVWILLPIALCTWLAIRYFKNKKVAKVAKI